MRVSLQMVHRYLTPGHVMNPRILSGGLQPVRRGSALQALSCPALALDPAGRGVRELRWEGHGTTERLLNSVQLPLRIKSPAG